MLLKIYAFIVHLYMNYKSIIYLLFYFDFDQIKISITENYISFYDIWFKWVPDILNNEKKRKFSFLRIKLIFYKKNINNYLFLCLILLEYYLLIYINNFTKFINYVHLHSSSLYLYLHHHHQKK